MFECVDKYVCVYIYTYIYKYNILKQSTEQNIHLYVFLRNTVCSAIFNLPLDIKLRLPRQHNGKESTCQCRRCEKCGFDLCLKKIPWSRIWRPAPVFLPGESHGQRNLVGYRPGGCKEFSDTMVHVHTHTHTHTPDI